MTRCATTTSLFVLAALMPCAPALGQPLGTFRWQLRPYCNVVSLAVVQEHGLYRLEGTDDQCGNGRDLASVTGLAFPNPDGTIGFGVTIVTAPGGLPVHVDAAITLATLGGSWRDSTGASGAFVFAPNGGNGGNPRPAAAPVVLPATVVLLENGTAPNTAGSRLLWHGERRAFRAGQTENGAWNDTNIGYFSAAFGRGTFAFGDFSFSTGFATRALGEASVAMGDRTQAMAYGATAFGGSTVASGQNSTAIGGSTAATGSHSTAMGRGTIASGVESTALGYGTQAIGVRSVAGGDTSRASGDYSLAMGSVVVAIGRASTALGENTTAGGNMSLAVGYANSTTGFASIAGGRESVANGDVSVALGTRAVTIAAADGSFVFADSSSDAPFASFAPNEFVVRAAGGVGFYTNDAATTGAEMAPGGGSWASLSDANMKENFRDVSEEELLAKVAALPVREWNYISQNASIRHLGPTAQDFRAAFGLGDFPLRINTTDADGVALAAIKALELRTRDLSTAIAEIAALRDRLAALEQLLNRR